jgi:type II secretory pathway pseudopilin PulG
MNIIKTNRRALQSGSTLVELSVVIAVILLLVGVLFMSVTAWKNAANKAAVMVQLSTIQKAVRGWENLSGNAVTEGTTPLLITDTTFVGTGAFLEAWPNDPAGTAYTHLDKVPPPSTAYAGSAVYVPTGPQIAGW